MARHPADFSLSQAVRARPLAFVQSDADPMSNERPLPRNTAAADAQPAAPTDPSKTAVYLVDLDGLVTSCNRAARQLSGAADEAIIGQPYSLFHTAEDRAAGVPERNLRHAREHGHFGTEGWRVRPDGSRFWASVVLDPVYDAAGQQVGFAKVIRDVTAEHAAQQALRDSEQRFRMLVQGVTDYALYMLSPQGVITNWNVGAQRIKGYAFEEVIDTHFSRFYTDTDRADDAPGRALRTAAEVGRYEQEGWRVRKDGSRFWAHVVIDAIHDPAGTLIGFAKITRDVTERKEAMAALERANAALFQSQKMEAIGQLTGGIAHDFNNLLAVVGSSVDLLAARLHEPSERRLLDGIHHAVDRGAALTQQLLSFARKQPLQVEAHNLNSLIGGFESMLRRASNASITFDIDLAAELPAVSVDAARFEAALLNLVVNARDAMPDGGTLRLRTALVALQANEVGTLAAGNYVCVSVRDTGVGMDERTVQRVLEPFFTTKPPGKGTGLGLSQVYGFITQSGGDLHIDSTPGAGTTVAIYLPAGTAAAAPSMPTDPEAGAAERVLIVEDEETVMEVATQLFRSLGFEVLTASNGRDALAVLEREPRIDLLFTDVTMPGGMDGIQLARKARALRPQMRVLLASGYPLPALAAQHGALDEFVLVNKPYRLSDLARKLRTLH